MCVHTFFFIKKSFLQCKKFHSLALIMPYSFNCQWVSIIKSTMSYGASFLLFFYLISSALRLPISIISIIHRQHHLLAILYRSSISEKTLRIDWQKEMRTIIYSDKLVLLKIRLRFRCGFVFARVLSSDCRCVVQLA